jgi:predicted RNA-binding Zn-ribbon protein involved in translation (DUF1610 family)
MKLIKDYGQIKPVEVDLIQTDNYCPNCGKKSVYVADDEGDFYVGPDYICIECKFLFSMPIGSIADEPMYKVSKE